MQTDRIHPNQKEVAPAAIVICLDSITGLQTARILAQRGVPVIGIAKDPRHFACRTNVCERIIIADLDSFELIRAIEDLRSTLKEKPVLFPCSDSSVLVLARHANRLSENFHVVLPPADVIEMMVDKVKFYRYAQENGFPIPETYFLASRQDAEETARKVTFPVILKPPYRPDEWRKHFRAKAFKVRDAAELLSKYDQCSQWTEVLIVQQWIDGPDTNHVTCNCYFSSESEPLVTFTSRKLRQWPQKTGQGCFGEAYRDEHVTSETVSLYRSLCWRGLGYLEMKRDQNTGKYYIIETNVGRPTGRSATAEANGVELLYTMYCEALGRPLPANREQKRSDVKWIYLRQDIQSALSSWLHGQLTLREWWQSMRGPKWFAIFSWKDPAPFWYDVGGAVVYQIKHQITKKAKRAR
jgi:predicted ATP-grasp superfamily ATP-dependent carboligase